MLRSQVTTLRCIAVRGDSDEAHTLFIARPAFRDRMVSCLYHVRTLHHTERLGDTMVVDRLRAVIAAAEKLPENEQEQLAALWEETLLDNTRWHKLFQQPGSQAFFAQLRAEAAEAEQNNTVEDSPDEDWA